MRVDDWLARAAEALPERPALIAGDRALSFAELEDEARAMARRLAGAGVGRGRPRGPAAASPPRTHVVLLHALTKLGAVAVPLDPGAPAPETDRLLAAVGPRLVVQVHRRGARGAGGRGGWRWATPSTPMPCIA